MKNRKLILALLGFVFFVGLLFARIAFSENMYFTAFVGIGFIAIVGLIIRENLQALKTRSAAFGIQSLVVVLLVLAIVATVNFLGAKYKFQKDLTKSQKHTLSDQTFKVVKGLKDTVKAVMYTSPERREQFRVLLESYHGISQKFDVEWVDPNKEPTRAKQNGIKKLGTLQLLLGKRDTKVEEPDEEKLTNTLIKITREKTPSLCWLTGHGEKLMSGTDADGYELVRKTLTDQAYEVKELNLLQEAKIPATCDALAIIGPTKAFFDKEILELKSYLENGGRMVVGFEMNIKGSEYAPEFTKMFEPWYFKATQALVVDPVSKMLGVDAATPLLISFSKDHPVTRDAKTQCVSPFTRPLEVLSGAPAGLNVTWLAQTTPQSWGEMNPKELATGAVKLDEADKKGPISAVISVEGKQKDSKATRNTRIIAFGSAQIGSNQFSRFGGNLDFFLNSINWIMEDESLISIRKKDDEPSKIDLSERAGSIIFILAVILFPLGVACSGVGIWFMRRRW